MSNINWEEDDRIGVPVIGRGNTPKPKEQIKLPSTDEPQLRAGETDLGKPVQTPRQLSELSDADRQKLREAEEQQALRELAEAEEMLASNPELKWFGWFTHPLATVFLLGSAGALGLFLYSQVLSILRNLATQPEWLQYAGYSGLVLCGSAVLYAMLRLLILYVKLKRNRQIRLNGLEQLNQRTRLRWLAQAKANEAKQQLEWYLESYPMTTERDRKKLSAIGLSTDRIAQLQQTKIELLDDSRFSSTDDWFLQFRLRFQNILDNAAKERVQYWAKRTGVVTAVAPNALVDSAATTYFGFAMLTDLCQIYNLRAGRTGTVVLLGRVFFNSYLAGQLNDWEKLTEDQLNHLMSPNGPLYELTAARVLSKVGAKATSGVLNYFLLSRLGRFACRLLRPVNAE